MKKYTLLLPVMLLVSYCKAQQNAKIILPQTNDKYAQFVAKLESGETDIDYKEFRFSFLASKQYEIKNRDTSYLGFREKIYNEVDKRNYQNVISLCKQMLSIDYTCMFAQKYLYQTYAIIGDTVNKKKYKDIELGLLTSIVSSGDGKSCETAWEVIQVEEEYFILNTLNLHFKEQSIDNSTRNLCDKMVMGTEDGTEYPAKNFLSG